MWKSLIDAGGPTGVRAQLLRELGVYGGAQGCWVDKERTKQVSPGGVTVGLLHTGVTYADDLSDDGVLYHYPTTRRQSGRDAAEVEATKEAARLKLPVFVVTKPSVSANTRDIHLGWVEGWDDDARMFLVSFGESQPPLIIESDEEEAPFELEDRSPQRRTTSRTSRSGQRRFRLRALKYYGVQCAVCTITHPSMLDAAHIRPKTKRGSDDPRNGLVLCPTHHRAFDDHLYGIEPSTLRIAFRDADTSYKALGVSRKDLSHLPRKPHRTALDWAWKHRGSGTWRCMAGNE